MDKNIWLIGSGGMAIDYLKVLQGLEVSTIVIGRGEKSAASFEEKTGTEVNPGGLKAFLDRSPELPDAAVVSVGIEYLAEVTEQLLKYGVKRILLEKPGGLNEGQIKGLEKLTLGEKADVYIAYNRRFYASVLKGLEIIQEDGGIKSFHFEFTEWSFKVKEWKKSKAVLERWFLGNSSHVADMAFFLGGFPKEMVTHKSGSLDWHPSASVFAGSGVSDRGAVFSYQANWSSPGRWKVEALTDKHRLLYCPLEKLQIQDIGQISTRKEPIDDELDITYKPGLYLQTRAFLTHDRQNLCSISEHAVNVDYYNDIAGY